MTPRAKDSLVSFGERLSSRIFSGYLSRLGVEASQFDAWDLGLETTDEFTNSEIIYETSLQAVGSSLKAYTQQHRTVPVVTGFVGKAASSGSFTDPVCTVDTTTPLDAAVLLDVAVDVCSMNASGACRRHHNTWSRWQ